MQNLFFWKMLFKIFAWVFSWCVIITLLLVHHHWWRRICGLYLLMLSWWDDFFLRLITYILLGSQRIFSIINSHYFCFYHGKNRINQKIQITYLNQIQSLLMTFFLLLPLPFLTHVRRQRLFAYMWKSRVLYHLHPKHQTAPSFHQTKKQLLVMQLHL